MLSDSEGGAISPLLFGTPRPLLAAASKLTPGIHPRIAFDDDEWQAILLRYSQSQSTKTSFSWASLYRTFSTPFGTKSAVIVTLASIHRKGMTARYQSRPYSPSSSYQTYRSNLAPLAEKIALAKPASGLNSLFLCALWALVDNDKNQNGKDQQQPQNSEPLTQCLNATYAWSTIVLAHRSFHCNPVCPQAGSARDRAYLWDTKRLWGIHHDWFLGCGALALTYDVLYPHMSPAFRTRVRSALAMIVHDRIAWGITNNDTSASTSGSLFSSNVYTEPHRSYSLSVARNAALFLATLAIEGEHTISLLDPYAWSVAPSFNAHAITAYAELLQQYFQHVFHPDGSPIDADDAYPVALRDAALALIALERRQRGFLSSPRFRNVVHHVLQISSPSFSTNAPCSTQPALRDPTHVALFRYVFPSGALPNMLWVRRLSFEFKDRTCHTLAFESAPHLAILGDEVDVEYNDPITQEIETAASQRKDIHSIRQLPPRLQALIPTTYYATRRGLFVSRSHLTDPAATHVTFDCRPDAFLLEHHRADRGIFTLSTHEVPWFVDIPWNLNGGSTRHSLMHIDGIGQIAAAPPCRTLSVRHTGSDDTLVIAAGDLSDAYRVHWAIAPHAHPPVLRHVVTVDYHDHNQVVPLPRSIVRRVNFTEQELRTPWDFGWPADDNASDIGFTRNMSLYGTPSVGTQGLWLWRRTFRNVQHVVRSLVSGRENVVIVVDSVKMGHSDEREEQELERMHVFESFLILHPAVSVLTPTESACNKTRRSCVLRLVNSATKSIANEIAVVDLYAFASYGQQISVRVDQIPLGTHESRLVIRSEAQMQEDIWLIFQPHTVPHSKVRANPNHVSQVFEFQNGVLQWSLSSEDHSMVYLHVDPVSHSIVTTKSNENPREGDSAAENLLPTMPLIRQAGLLR